MIIGQKKVLGNSTPSLTSSTVHDKKHHNLFQIVLSGHALKESRGSNKTSNIIVITAIVSLLSIVTVVLFPFGQSQAAAALLQKNTSNNNPYFSLTILSTAAGTGAAATGIMTTIPGVLRTRKQSKYLIGYLLKIHYKYDEVCTNKSTDIREYLDFLQGLRGEIIYLLQRRHINENQYKMLDDRIIEYITKITNLR
ncbi:MAG: hypothetical protein WAM42_20210, partial [Candidatus Nitrosopolaris sp.]